MALLRHPGPFETRLHPLLPWSSFLRRLGRHALVAAALIGASLGVGMVGYHATEGLPWLDAFLNASMLLGGMGPVDPLRSDGGKLFAGLYAMYCGLVLLLATGVLLAPVAHRVLHAFHLDPDQDGGSDAASSQRASSSSTP